MRGVIAFLGALGVGAVLMYFLDPERGNRRRALVRDKATKINRQTQQAVTGKVKDIGNRARGVLHEAKSVFESGDESTQQQPTTF